MQITEIKPTTALSLPEKIITHESTTGAVVVPPKAINTLLSKEYADLIVKEYFEFANVGKWKEHSSTGGVQCFSKADHRTGLCASKANITLDYSADQIKDLLSDLRYRKSYDPKFDFEETLCEKSVSKLNENNGDVLKLVYSASKSVLNIISPRDFITVFQQRALEDSGYLLVAKGVHPSIYNHPLHNGRTRGFIHLAGWCIEPIRLASEGIAPVTKLTYVVHVDVAGNIPLFLLNSTASGGQRGEMLLEIKKALKKVY